ncbi:MAG: DMT family transporter [Lachnospiraceae bacterium]|nr:DMT family transporter [Lachnospiraceae bacterium]
MNKFVLRQSILLFLTAVIWGVAFVAQSAGMEYVGPFTYNGTRCILGGLVLLPCIVLLDRIQGGRNAAGTEAVKDMSPQEAGGSGKVKKGKTLLIGGLCCGIILFAASNFQQVGIQYTSVGKAGFITAMYILLVPIMGLFIHKKVGVKVWIGVAFAVCGLYLLCMTNGFKLEKGDALVLICAFIFALHILVIDYFSPKVDGVRMSCIQFWVCGVLSLICSFVFEKPELGNILAAWQPVCYGGIMSCGVAYTLQIVGQKDMNPTVASLILSLESVVSVVAGFLILNQTMSRRELLGCCLMVVAIVLAQLPDRGGMIGRDKKI